MKVLCFFSVSKQVFTRASSYFFEHAVRLSNFTNRTFFIDGFECAGIEGFLQALKASSLSEQQMVCGLNGGEAKEWGKNKNEWKIRQILYWDTKPYGRLSRSYHQLITRMYDEVFQQDPSFCSDLKMIGHEEICYTIGKCDPSDTVLTELEMLYQINRLRIKAFLG
ncbi:hypothetical protein KC723_01755 [Candidatus Kaiserbacteria bacterium]|nr:hypothetical protein [Candidatus Kaiserbacteria bacterium]